MARGWDRGGNVYADASSWRTICGSPPGPGTGEGEEGGGAGGLRPNCFCGLTPWDATPPLITLGAGDYSFEYWSLWKLVRSPSSDTSFYVGFLFEDPPFLEEAGCIRHESATQRTSTRYDDIPGGVNISGGPNNVPPWWSHVACNFTRLGTMDTYVNGVLETSVAINNNDQGNVRFYALTGGINQENQYNDNDGLLDWSAFVQARVLVGPIAAHNRLMTVGEISNSYLGKRVQNFRAPDTTICWDWRLIERLDGEPIDWEFNEGRMQESVVSCISGLGIAAPIGAAGTIRVPDLSGSGNHWVLPTLAEYAEIPAITGRARVAFITHPFWMSS